MEKDINPEELDFLLRYPAVPGLTSPVDFLSNLSWGGIKVSAFAVFTWNNVMINISAC